MTDDEFRAQFARAVGPALEAEIQQRKAEAVAEAIATISKKLLA